MYKCFNHPYHEMSEVCSKVVHDDKTGNVVCSMCGLVLGLDNVNETNESRGPEDKRSRISILSDFKFLKNKAGLLSLLKDLNYIIYTKVDLEIIREDMYGYSKRIIKKTLQHLENRHEWENLKKKDIISKNLIPILENINLSKNNKVLIAAAMYVSFNTLGIFCSINQLSKKLEINAAKVENMIKFICDSLNIDTFIFEDYKSHIENAIRYICSSNSSKYDKVINSKNILIIFKDAVNYYENFRRTSKYSSKAPQTIYAGSIFKSLESFLAGLATVEEEKKKSNCILDIFNLISNNFLSDLSKYFEVKRETILKLLKDNY